MKHKNITKVSAIIAVSILLLGACAGKMTVSNTPADEPVSQATEPAPVEPAEQVKESPPVVEVIPLDATLAKSTAQANADAAAPASEEQQAPEKSADATPPPQQPLPNPDITGITKQMLDHRNTLWHSRDKTFRLYVGDQFATEYSPDNKTFVIRSDVAGSNLECKYSMDGKLDTQHADQKAACNALINNLVNYLSSN